MPDFTFNEKMHIYKNKGVRIPSVTQVLNEWVKIQVNHNSYYVHTVSGVTISEEIFRYAGERGNAIHSGAKLVLEGILDWETLDPILVAPLRQFEAWKKKYDIHIGINTQCEVAMMSERHQFAGRPDIITDIKGVMSIIDIKSASWGQVAAQLSAYEQLFRENTGYRKQINLYVLDLTGKYRFQQIQDAGAWPFFLNSLSRFRYLTKKNV